MINGAVEVALSNDGILMLLDTGTVTAVGFTDPLPLPDSVRGAQVKAISGCHSGIFLLALLNDTGRVVAWRTDPNSAARVMVPDAALSGVASMDCGNGHALALLANGSVIQWGLDPDDDTSLLAPVPDILSGGASGGSAGGGQPLVAPKVLQVVAGMNYSLALVQDAKDPAAKPCECDPQDCRTHTTVTVDNDLCHDYFSPCQLCYFTVPIAHDNSALPKCGHIIASSSPPRFAISSGPCHCSSSFVASPLLLLMSAPAIVT
jgi:hypothetical protein